MVTPVVATATGAPGISKITPKVRDQWLGEDRRLIHLDTRLQNLVLASVPERMVTTLLKYKTTKVMWDRLVSQMEGGAMTINAQKVAMNKQYDNFFALKNETLS